MYLNILEQDQVNYNCDAACNLCFLHATISLTAAAKRGITALANNGV